jgi:signal transduction histidine kinase
MKKSTRWLLALCIFAVAGVFLLQSFWIRNYYFVNKAAFEKEVNLVFEDALKKEFSVRCDSIEKHVFHLLLDTNEFILSNRYSTEHYSMMLSITDKRNLKDKYAFTINSLKEGVLANDTGPAKVHLAKVLANLIREDDLSNHMVWYRTQKLGEFINSQELKYDFDTARLRPIFTKLLAGRSIYVPFAFYVRRKDSTYNESNFKAGLLANYPVITKAYITYKRDKNQHYIRAMFKSPLGYIITKMGLIFLGSVFLIIMISFSLFFLFKSLLTEKKLSLLKNDFISNITHELKTPIATVSAAVEALADFDALEDPEKTKRYLSHSKNELRRLSSLVDTILNSTLYENQQFEINPEWFNVDKMMQGIIDQYNLVGDKKVIFSYQNNSKVIEVSADKALFQQVMGNIIDNAIKYSGDKVLIAIEGTSVGGFLIISIKDNGIGIPAEHIPYLFGKFYRVPSGNQHKIKGHGLGLNYVKSIMQRHNGWCKIKSEQGRWTIVLTGWPI